MSPASSAGERPPRPRRRPKAGITLLPLLFLAAAAVPGCGRDDATASGTALTTEQFIEVMVELREAEREVLGEDSAAELFARRKAEILERHQTSEEEIRVFALAAARDLPKLTRTWEEIADRLRRPAAAETLEPQ